MFLAADIGGTNARFALFVLEQGRLVEIDRYEIPTATIGGAGCQHDPAPLAGCVARFVAGRPLTGACLACAGPVRGGRVFGFSLCVDARAIAAALGLAEVALINDLVANIHGLPLLAPADLLVVNSGNPDPAGTIAVLSAGTGLGAALAIGTERRPVPTEGGNAGFAPQDSREDELVAWLRHEHGDAACHRILSGSGLVNLYRFVAKSHANAMTPAMVLERAQENECPDCLEAVRLFCRAYGGEARSLALRSLATGGVFLGGGLTARLAPFVALWETKDAFIGNDKFSPLLADIPLAVVRNERTALLGAARWAAGQ